MSRQNIPVCNDISVYNIIGSALDVQLFSPILPYVFLTAGWLLEKHLVVLLHKIPGESLVCLGDPDQPLAHGHWSGEELGLGDLAGGGNLQCDPVVLQ